MVLIRTFVEDVVVPYYLIYELEIASNIDQSLCPPQFFIWQREIGKKKSQKQIIVLLIIIFATGILKLPTNSRHEAARWKTVGLWPTVSLPYEKYNSFLMILQKNYNILFALIVTMHSLSTVSSCEILQTGRLRGEYPFYYRFLYFVCPNPFRKCS